MFSFGAFNAADMAARPPFALRGCGGGGVGLDTIGASDATADDDDDDLLASPRSASFHSEVLGCAISIRREASESSVKVSHSAGTLFNQFLASSESTKTSFSCLHVHINTQYIDEARG